MTETTDNKVEWLEGRNQMEGKSKFQNDLRSTNNILITNWMWKLREKMKSKMTSMILVWVALAAGEGRTGLVGKWIQPWTLQVPWE